MCKKQKNGKGVLIAVSAILLSGVAIAGLYGAWFSGTFPFSTTYKTEASPVTAQAQPNVVDVNPLSDVIASDNDEAPAVTSQAYKMLNKVVRDELRQGRPSYALRLLNADPLAKKIKNSEYDQLQASIAQSYMNEGMVKRAYDVAKTSSHRSQHDTPYAAWVGGLAAWRLNDFNNAASLFSTAADSPRSSSWLQAASAFWASRSYDKIHNFAKATSYMEVAANHPRTFYGLIALKSLDRDYDFNWDKPNLKSRHKKTLEASMEVQKAIDLSKKGDMGSAIRQLGKSGWLDQGGKQRQLLAYVLEKDAPALALHLGRSTRTDHGGFYDAALYPEAPWGAEQGGEIDRALVNALIRQESRFDPQARNASGASGLMQLMPSTASYMAKGIDVSLTHPETNINVGQKYVRHLLMDPAVNNDLFYMAIAYNAGPGNLSRWKHQFKDIKDPLLFIESVPSSETRAFVERVMVNYWIYRIRMGKDNPSLDAVAAGHRSEYVDAGVKHPSIQLASEN